MVSSRIRKALSFIIVILCLVLALGMGLLFGYRYILNQDTKFREYEKQVEEAKKAERVSNDEDSDNTVVTTTVPYENQVVIEEDSPGSIAIYIDLGDSTKTIATKLKDKGVIDNVTVFTIFSKFNGFDGSYKYGTHFVRKNMSFDQVMFVLSQEPATRMIRFSEALTYEDMKKVLSENKVYFDEKKLDALVKDPNTLLDYDLVSMIPSMKAEVDDAEKAKRDNALQGYLFPDTYRFDMNASEETILRTFLNNMENKISDEYRERASKMGMSVDQIITLASIIQKESGVLSDMRKVSRVFYNRINAGDYLQSDATVNYIRKRAGKDEEYFIYEGDLSVDDPYNTYQHPGLPPGPICSPGLDAIKAALYPDTENMDIYYFVADGEGKNVFAETYEGHQQNLEKYFYPLQE